MLAADDRRNLAEGRGLAYYDALLLHADEDTDFVKFMLEKLENKFGLKVSKCLFSNVSS